MTFELGITFVQVGASRESLYTGIGMGGGADTGSVRQGRHEDGTECDIRASRASLKSLDIILWMGKWELPEA